MKKEKVDIDLISKKVIIKNYLKYTNDKALLVTVLDNLRKDSFTDEEVKELIKNEMERVIN